MGKANVKNADFEGDLSSAAIECGLIALVLCLPVLAVAIGIDGVMDPVYGNVLGNVSGVVDDLAR